MTEGEATQECAERGRGHDPVAEHLGGLTGAEHIGVINTVAADHQRVQQRQHLAARPVGAGALAQVDQLVDHRLDPEPLRQGGGQQQSGVGDRVLIVEGDRKAVWTVGGWHRESALLIGMDGRLSNAILPVQRAFLIIGSCPHRQSNGGSRLGGGRGTS